MGVLNGLLDLAVLTDKVEGIAEPVGIGDDRDRQIADRRRDGGIACGEPGLPIKGRWRPFVNRRNSRQLVGIGLLEVDRINGHHQHLGLLLLDIVLGQGVETLEYRLRTEAFVG
jgi:hypothetical protein